MIDDSISPPLKWHGGKHYLAKRIIERMPPHVHYVEPFFGGGAVFLAKPRELIENHSEVVNDLHRDLIRFWLVLRDPEGFAQFARFVQATPFSEEGWRLSDAVESGDEVTRAARFFIRFRQSRQGLGESFATMSRSRTRRGMNEQASSWLTAVEGLPAAHERLKRVVILNSDALDVIRREDSPHTFFYLDPPYVHATRATPNSYEHELPDDEHAKLLELLGTLEGKFLLSGYNCALYEKHAARRKWTREDFEIDNKASASKMKAKKVESLWRNF